MLTNHPELAWLLCRLVTVCKLYGFSSFVLQSKKATLGVVRSALGEIGNKNIAGHSSVSDKDVKKLLTGPQKKVPQMDEKVAVVVVKEPEQELVPSFPEGVLDIDGVEEDQMNPQLCVEYAPAIYSYLRGVEEGLSIGKDFLQG